MPGLDWNHLAADEALGFGISILTMLLIISISVWFACSVVVSVIEMGRRIHRPNYDALLRENERLRNSLVDARQENDYLRKLYRNDLPPRYPSPPSRMARTSSEAPAKTACTSSKAASRCSLSSCS
jgi:hypothetical protein